MPPKGKSDGLPPPRSCSTIPVIAAAGAHWSPVLQKPVPKGSVGPDLQGVCADALDSWFGAAVGATSPASQKKQTLRFGHGIRPE